MAEDSFIVSEPEMQDWGGSWTNLKLEAFIAYVKAYLAIMEKYKYWETIYFDGFAGSGERIRKKEIPDQITMEFDESSLVEIDVYRGSVSRILELSPPIFDYYYFIDTNLDNISKINELSESITHIKKDRIIARDDDCNKQLIKLSKAFEKKKLAALVFIDPFGMQVNWESIAALKGTRSDIWILIPSGVIVNRLLPKKGKIKNKEKLESFFGLSIDQIRDIFYHKEEGESLFGDNYNETSKLDNPIERIVQLYSKQMKNVWKNVSSPLILKNSKNVPIFHLIFASNNPTAMKIASQIIIKKSK